MYGYFKLWFGRRHAAWLYGVWLALLTCAVCLCAFETPADFGYMGR